ncbi:hypothetical protein GT755_23195 [Herbidospora sp. NEAU-GS84]|uniref:Uncharacterized protein n=1 Tax=Herbidospora solisilvae TaxID=2696284 RepID=A0A7C9JDQ0_9ACTN|nr:MULTISPECIES: hypothetical protein [Herbidospora]NAS24584.1 hypothetical protein [Herbidospora solisilvae]
MSPWNEVLSQGLLRDLADPSPYDGAAWSERWIAGALLSGRKPFGRFTLPLDEAQAWCIRARRVGLEYHRERVDGNALHITAGREETYGELFELDALVAYYRDVLPPEAAETAAWGLLSHRKESPANHTFAGVDAFAELPRAVRGLTLGYPPLATARRILLESGGENEIEFPDVPLDPGRPEPAPLGDVPVCDHDHPVPRFENHDDLVKACEPLTDLVSYYWQLDRELSMFAPRISGVYLADYPEALIAAFEAHARAASTDRYPRAEAVFAHMCCVLRHLGREPDDLLRGLRPPSLRAPGRGPLDHPRGRRPAS